MNHMNLQVAGSVFFFTGLIVTDALAMLSACPLCVLPDTTSHLNSRRKAGKCMAGAGGDTCW